MSTFSLAGRGLKLDSKGDLEQHIGPLTSSTSIKHIDLSGNTFGVGACEALAPILAKLDLESADLHDIFTSRSLAEIPPALTHLLTALLNCSKLYQIDLSDNAFGLNTKDPLVDFLSKHIPLQHLILNNNGMGPIAGTAIAEALSILAMKKEDLRKTGADVPYLESVVCGRNRLENGSMPAWSKAYEAHKKGMKSVKMTQNGIRPEGMSALIRSGLSHCSGLEVLDMQDNTFTIVGANALMTAIKGWPSLKELGVGDSLLGARGSIKVFEALAQGNNKLLEILRLQYNEINPAGLKALLQAVKDGLPALRRVELNGNKFDEDDPNVEDLASLLSERKDEHGQSNDPDDHWGLDELDELEGEDSDEEAEDEVEEEEEEQEKIRQKQVKMDDQAENSQVSQKQDDEVDVLADALARTKV